MTGRAIALAWRPWWHVVASMLLIACAVASCISRCSAKRCSTGSILVVDAVVLLVFGLLGFRLTRVAQMVGCYGWINERAGAFQVANGRAVEQLRIRMTTAVFAG